MRDGTSSVSRPTASFCFLFWKWVSLAEVRLADQHVPRIGEDPKDWKKRLKEQKKKK